MEGKIHVVWLVRYQVVFTRLWLMRLLRVYYDLLHARGTYSVIHTYMYIIYIMHNRYRYVPSVRRPR